MLFGEPHTGTPPPAVIGPTILSAVLGQLWRELGAVIVFPSLHRIGHLSSVCCNCLDRRKPALTPGSGLPPPLVGVLFCRGATPTTDDLALDRQT
jgi:hypothetical protein